MNYGLRIKKYIIAALLLHTLAAHAQGEDNWEKWGPARGLNEGGFIVRAGYVVGGTMPLPLPAEIRSINQFSPKGGVSLGIDGYRMFSKRWGISLGAHFFWEGFHTSADVKNYYVSYDKESDGERETKKGYFTGTNATATEMWGVTFPLLATFRISPRWNVSAGPYLSWYFSQTFTGEVYENSEGIGYLRENTPIGVKIPVNDEHYDFSDNMLPLGVGMELCFDWKAMRRMNVFGKVDWGLSNVWRSDFDAITFKMFPIYATIGAAYRY